MPKLFIGWHGELGDSRSYYDVTDNKIVINPYYPFDGARWFWVPFIHELGHWFLSKLCKGPILDVREVRAFWVVNDKWDWIQANIIMDRIMFWIYRPWLHQ